MVDKIEQEWLELFTHDVKDIWKTQPHELRIILAMHHILEKEFRRVEHDYNNRIEHFKNRMKFTEGLEDFNNSHEARGILSDLQSNCTDVTLLNRSPKIKRHRKNPQRNSTSPSLLNVPKEKLNFDCSFSLSKPISPVGDKLSEAASLLTDCKSNTDNCDLVDSSIIILDTDENVKMKTKVSKRSVGKINKSHKNTTLTQLFGVTRSNAFGEITEKGNDKQNQILERQPKSNLLRNYDRVTIPKSNTPEYPHKTDVVRRKVDRMNLPGWSCTDCKKYYEGLNLPLDELREKMNICSKHRNKFEPLNETPKGFWDITIFSSEDD